MPSKKKSSRKPATRATNKEPDLTRSDLVEVRNSPIHGRGVYAVKNIKQGTRIYEYVGERITHSEADRRFARKPEDDGHTFLFVVNHKTVIDGSSHGNDARYINHRCDANCETVTEGNRIFIEATRDIKTGQELGYDYQLTWSDHDDPEDLKLYACRCGSKQCRGTMLDKLSVERNRALERAKKKRAQVREATRAAAKKSSTRTQRAKKPAKKKSAARAKRGAR
jgi:uncharacterized protein